MKRPLIAIVGSVDPTREDELQLRDVAQASRAGEDLGRALAAAQCDILVYSSDRQFIEADVVRGYLDHGQAPPNCIQVRAPISRTSALFSEAQHHPAAFDSRPDTSGDWQVSFYRSLVEVDGVVLIGGGRSTLVAGLVALALRIPVLPVAAFGGETANVWTTLDRVRNDVTDEDIALMGRPWTSTSAEQGVASLLRQRERREKQQRETAHEQARYKRRAVTSLTVAALLLIVGLAIIPLVFALEPGVAGNVAALLATPMLVAPCGAIIRNVLDVGTDWWRTALLGLVAGAIAGVLFVLAQLAASPDLLEGEAARRLLLFLAAVGFVAGLTFAEVYGRLRTENVVDTGGLSGRQRTV